MGKVIEFFIDERFDGERLDKVISANVGDITRSYAQKLIKNRCVHVDEEMIRDKNYTIVSGQAIKIDMPPPVVLDIVPEDIPIDIVYEDDDLMVINKPKGMVVHPAAGNYSGTLVNALMHYCGKSLSTINGVIRPGIVHRLDKDTSGLLMVAKNDFAHRGLAVQIIEHSFLREYEAVVYGNVKKDADRIDAPVGRSKIDRKKMTVTNENSRPATTYYKVIRRFGDFTHIRLRLETGRTHQIRVHMAHIGHPVAGDPLYGPKKIILELGGQCLHAKYIGFVHPRTYKYLQFESELPAYFKDFLKTIGG